MWIIPVVLVLVFLGSFALTGIQILTDPHCSSVSFGGQHGSVGGRGIFFLQATCHEPGTGGWLNSTLAGILMILPALLCLGVVIFIFVSVIASARKQRERAEAEFVASFLSAAQKLSETSGSSADTPDDGPPELPERR